MLAKYTYFTVHNASFYDNYAAFQLAAPICTYYHRSAHQFNDLSITYSLQLKKETLKEVQIH